MVEANDIRPGGHTAFEIATKLSQISKEGLVTGNFALFRSCFHLPHRMMTFDGSYTIKDDDDLRKVFAQVREQLLELKIDQYERAVTFAKFVGPDRLAATHESYLYRNGELIGEPAVAMSTVERRNGVWGVASSQYAVETTHALAKLTREDNFEHPSDEPPTTHDGLT